MKYPQVRLTVLLVFVIWLSLILTRKWTSTVPSKKRANCGLCILRQMNALTHKFMQSRERLMKIYIKIYFLTLKFIIPWTYAKEQWKPHTLSYYGSMNNRSESRLGTHPWWIRWGGGHVFDGITLVIHPLNLCKRAWWENGAIGKALIVVGCSCKIDSCIIWKGIRCQPGFLHELI